MENSQVTIKGLTRVQANCLAVLCEDGTVAGIINKYMKNLFDDEKHQDDPDYRGIDDDTPNMDFDDDERVVAHEAEFAQ